MVMSAEYVKVAETSEVPVGTMKQVQVDVNDLN